MGILSIQVKQPYPTYLTIYMLGLENLFIRVVLPKYIHVTIYMREAEYLVIQGRHFIDGAIGPK
ncbi:hypothetical protein ES708_29485 [subsurface metagenome]